MRKISAAAVQAQVCQMCKASNFELGNRETAALRVAAKAETSSTARYVLQQLELNASIAKERPMALCQDTGMVVVFVEIGQDVMVVGEFIGDAINAGVRQAYQEECFRESVVRDPLLRDNSGDNTPAVIHYRLVPGDHLRLKVAPKGFGSENMSKIKMLTPAHGVAGVKKFVLDTIKTAGAKPCPPVVVGVGLGGTMEMAALMAKEALLRPLGQKNAEEHIAQLEVELLEAVNALGIGPQGFGGRTTALAVHVKTHPTHIAGLPAAVNLNCHISRHRVVVL